MKTGFRFWSALATVAATPFALVLCVRGEKSEPRVLGVAEVEPAVKALWSEIVPKYDPSLPLGKRREWQMQHTTWLPSEWPPTKATIWTQYAYGLDVTMDGLAGVSAPFARIERRSGDDTTRALVPMSRKVHTVANHPVRPHGGWHYTAAEEDAVLKQVLALSAAPADSKRIAAYYQSWRLGSAEIAAQIAPRHKAFFSWLKKQQAQ